MRARLAALAALLAALLPSAAPADPLFGTGLSEAERCDPIDPVMCLYPFPNDHFTRLDPSTDTGLRLNLSPLSMPRNVSGKPIDPTEWNRNDGFSPGSLIVTYVPGIDIVQTGAPRIFDMADSLEAASPIVLLNARTGARHPFWAEIDAVTPNPDPTADPRRALLIRPARNLDEGTRYVVGLRNMRRADGSTIAPSHAFRVYRDRLYTTDPSVEVRRAAFEDVFARLDAAGFGPREDLYLAWAFTVASERNLAERILDMRDESISALAGAAPTFVVDHVTEQLPCRPDVDVDIPPGASCNPLDARVGRQIDGHFLVPCYLRSPGCAPGANMSYGLDDLPEPLPGNTMVAQFQCNVPKNVFDPANPAVVNTGSPSLYGHGLLGLRTEINAGNVKDMGQEHRFVFCATDWAGMSTFDVPNVAHTLVDVTNFSTMVDRMQQGILNQLFLARLLKHPLGLLSDPSFRSPGGAPLYDNSEVYYDGNSQGGIMGGAVMAVSTDITRGVLGVPGMNYSTLLDRSVDFDQYSVGMYASYHGRLTHQLIFSLIQILWDRGETNGYAHHMTTDPYPGTPQHRILMHVAFGDHQVAQVSADVEARTIGAAVVVPGVDTGRSTDLDPFWGIAKILGGDYPYYGSAMVYWDTHNTPPPPIDNLPPRLGSDPHGRPRSQASARLQKATFLRTGAVINVCGLVPPDTAGHCHAT